MNHFFDGRHAGYIVFLVTALFLAVRSCFVDVFIDESDSAPSDEATEARGWKATKVTRSIMVGVFLLMAGFAGWKMYQP